MCGIVGFIDYNKKMNKQSLESMNNTLIRRGPDSSGLHFEVTRDYHMGLGHRRLSIIDLDIRADQPMYFDNLVIVYNGEVYNYIELREELRTFGYIFETNSDTEVILKAFHKWGVTCVDHFNGMFAFAVFDKDKLYLFRDRLGEKPLYWYYDKGVFLFGSELKSFHSVKQFRKEIDKDALALYFQYGYIKAPKSIFKQCYKLEPATYLEFDGKVYIKKYWQLEKKQYLSNVSFEYLKDKIKKSIDLRLRSDVEVGVFLSGGIDSSLISVLIEKRLKTFTLGFEESNYDERNYAKAVAQYANKEYHEIIIGQRDTIDIIEDLPDIYDEPMADNSVIPTVLLAQFAAKSVKVVLGADGGDELFFGYDRYRYLLTLQKYAALKYLVQYIPSLAGRSHLAEKIGKIQAMIGENPQFQSNILNKVFWGNDLVRLGLNNADPIIDWDEENDIDKLLLKDDIDGYLSNYILTKVDRATMYASIEGREPLLDHRLIELAYNMPLEKKFADGETKYPLKKILETYLPKSLIYRKKQGFGMPIYEWFKRGEGKTFLLSYVNEEEIRRQGLLNYNEVEKILDNYFQNKRVNPLKIWFILVFQQWHKRWM